MIFTISETHNQLLEISHRRHFWRPITWTSPFAYCAKYGFQKPLRKCEGRRHLGRATIIRRTFTVNFFLPRSSFRREHLGSPCCEALEETIGVRDSFASVLGTGIENRPHSLQARSTVDQIILEISSHSEAGQIFDGGLAQFLAEYGLLPMYGMPTRVRPLYLGLKPSGNDGVAWDSIDRDMDVAIYEFAPGQALIRDKRLHQPIGFTGSLQKPRRWKTGLFAPVDPTARWFTDAWFLAKCPTCYGTTSRQVPPAEAVVCADCSSRIDHGSFREYFVPGGFRTDFQPRKVDESERTEMCGARHF